MQKHILNRQRSLCFAVLFAFLALGSWARADEFEVTAPKNWQVISKAENGTIYKNMKSKHNQVIVTQKVQSSKPGVTTVNQIINAIQGIRDAREAQLELFGLHDLTIMGVEQVPVTMHENIESLQIESSYRGVMNQTVQAVEYKYFAGSAVY
jgi:hypothetical protein